MRNSSTCRLDESTHKQIRPDLKLKGKSAYPDLRIIVLTFNRAKSLQRLLDSLNGAIYYSEKVVLEVWIDRSQDDRIDQETLNISSQFHFNHGKYSVRCHVTHVGIFGQWLDTWRPDVDSPEIAVILEDDLTVSPFFYKWLKMVHLKYDSYHDINGYALQGVSIKHSGASGHVEAPTDALVYRYPTLGTWGFSPVTSKWVAFKQWYTKVRSIGLCQPLVPWNIATEWYQTFVKTNKTAGMWEIWHIYYAWENKDNTLYSNFGGNHKCFTVYYTI